MLEKTTTAFSKYKLMKGGGGGEGKGEILIYYTPSLHETNSFTKLLFSL